MMRILWYNASVLLVLALYFGVHAQDLNNRKDFAVKSSGAQVTRFLDEHEGDVLNMMQNHFDLSIKYLYTGIGYGSQLVQRPGMSKLLKEQSDSHWEDGISMLKKFMQRGGDASDLVKKFQFSGKNELGMLKSETEDTRISYLNTIDDLLKDSKECAKDLNSLHRMSARRTMDIYSPHHDGEWSHYLEEKLEEEAERTRKLAGYVTDLETMFNSGMAIHFFDSNL